MKPLGELLFTKQQRKDASDMGVFLFTVMLWLWIALGWAAVVTLAIMAIVKFFRGY